MGTPEIHLFILWEKARYKESAILEDMAKHFTILKQYAITWTPELVASNFTRFYGVNLPSNSFKEKECGSGEFLLCVVRDEKPVYEERMTSRGPEIVNVNMFDAKDRYRSWTCGGHKIHGTNNEKETNHDLSLLIGKNVANFLSENENSAKYETLQRDIEDVNGLGVCIKSINLKCCDKVTNDSLQWESSVYKKDNSFVKKGTPWLIDNENDILSQLNLPFVPKLLASGKDGDASWIEITSVEGMDLDEFLSVRSNFTIKNIRDIVVDGLKNIIEIYRSGVMHRDINPGNILVYKKDGRCKCNIIDFGSAIKYKEKAPIPCPSFLGDVYAPEDMYSDFYSMGQVSLSICGKMPYLKRIANELAKIQWDNYQDERLIKEVVKRTLRLCKRPMTLRDYYAFYRKKYSAWRKYVQNPVLVPKQLLVRIKRVLRKLI